MRRSVQTISGGYRHEAIVVTVEDCRDENGWSPEPPVDIELEQGEDNLVRLDREQAANLLTFLRGVLES